MPIRPPILSDRSNHTILIELLYSHPPAPPAQPGIGDPTAEVFGNLQKERGVKKAAVHVHRGTEDPKLHPIYMDSNLKTEASSKRRTDHNEGKTVKGESHERCKHIVVAVYIRYLYQVGNVNK